MQNSSDAGPASRNNRGFRLVGAALAVLVGLSLVGCDLEDSGNAKVKTGSHKTTDGGGATSDPTPAADPGTRPVVSDIGLHVIVKSKQCFGSIGCNIEYNVAVRWLGATPIHLNGSYDVKYAVSGDEAGPQIQTLTIHPNGKYGVPDGGYMSTSSNYTKPGVRVISVRKHLGY